MAADTHSFHLPAPPSTNSLYSGRRFKTERYKAWLEAAGWELKLQRVQPVAGAFMLSIRLPGKCDLDNLKAVPDLLVGMGIIPDDRRQYMRRLTVEPALGDKVVVTITPLVG